MKNRFSEEQIIGYLREAEAGLPSKDLCRRHGLIETLYYVWRSKFGGMSVPDAKRLKELEAENSRLKKLLAEQVFEYDLIKDALRKMWRLHRLDASWCGIWWRRDSASGDRWWRCA